jgi:large subunit ribosomal protein L6
MSRLGKQPITIPEKVKVKITDGFLHVSGQKGELKRAVPAGFEVKQENGKIFIMPEDANKPDMSALHGLERALINNMVIGVTQGYTKELEIQGVGFKAAVQGNKLVFNIGFSSPKELMIPAGITAQVAENVKITISGADKQLVGDFTARIRSLYPPEPYKGKGIRYKGEHVKRKAGKTVA